MATLRAILSFSVTVLQIQVSLEMLMKLCDWRTDTGAFQQSDMTIPSRASAALTVAARRQEQWHAKMKTEKE